MRTSILSIEHRIARSCTIATAAAAVLLIVLITASEARAATAVSVFPIPGDQVATRHTQIVIRGVPTSQFGAISVTGSKSGAHSGVVKADSDGLGGSFIASKPFTAGETVTVRTALNVIGGHNGSWRFTVETPAHPTGEGRIPVRAPGAASRFRTVGVEPAEVKVLTAHKGIAPGDLFLAPQSGPVQNGVEIFNSVGHLVYFKPIPRGETATGFRVQDNEGQPDLTWWQGNINTSGVGRGVDEIYNSSYQPVATVRAGNALVSDLHEFLLGANGTAWVTAYQAVIVNASQVKGGSRHEIVYDAVAQEIDIKTGLVLFQWDSLDHVALGASYAPVARHPGTPWDYFHINSIQPQADGSVLISARNTSAIYRVNGQTGQIEWTLGGKFSSFKLGPGVRFWYQHDAELQPNGQLTVFDDAGAPFREPQSRGLTLNLDTANMTATLAQALTHSPRLRCPAEGSVQPLPNGDKLVGWGQANNTTEYNAQGTPLFDLRFAGANVSYRAYRFPWTGTPTGRPAVATRTYRGQTSVSASWNGTTVTHAWRILGGDSAKSLTPIATDRKTYFETTMQTHHRLRYVEVQAVDPAGKVLGSSPVVKDS